MKLPKNAVVCSPKAVRKNKTTPVSPNDDQQRHPAFSFSKHEIGTPEHSSLSKEHTNLLGNTKKSTDAATVERTRLAEREIEALVSISPTTGYNLQDLGILVRKADTQMSKRYIEPVEEKLAESTSLFRPKSIFKSHHRVSPLFS